MRCITWEHLCSLFYFKGGYHMEYLFVLSTEGGWWLKIDTIEQLTDYHKKTDGHRYENALRNFFHGNRPEDLLRQARDSKNPEDLISLYTNRDFQYEICNNKRFETGDITTDFIAQEFPDFI